MVQDPVVITFDEDGRLWVVEMRGFMPNIDGEGENKPVGRISVLEDTNGDGQMDVSKVYLDSLVMPRALALVPGGALVAENGALWLTKDRNGDLQSRYQNTDRHRLRRQRPARTFGQRALAQHGQLVLQCQIALSLPGG